MMKSHDSTKVRKKQNREAQAAYRKRKHASDTARDRRVRSLEDMIERLSSTFIAFTEDVLNSQSARRGTPLLNNILETTRVFHGIAKETVAYEADDEPFFDDGKVSSPSSIGYNALQNGTSTMVSSQTNNNDRPLHGISENSFQLATSPSSPPLYGRLHEQYSSPHMQPQVLGNGWLYTPVPVLHAPLRMDDYLINVPEFCLRLVETTIATSYTLLLADTFINRESEGTFRWSGRYTTREGLLYCMRWMLGPGRKNLALAVNVPANLCASYLATGRNVTLQGGVSSISNDEHDVEPPTLPSLLNAADVLQKLKELNCRFMDGDAIEITVRSAGTEFARGQKNWFLDRFSVQQPPHESSALTLRLSKALLLSNLAYCAICLGQGPGYPMEDFARIVEASATSASESGPLLA